MLSPAPLFFVWPSETRGALAICIFIELLLNDSFFIRVRVRLKEGYSAYYAHQEAIAKPLKESCFFKLDENIFIKKRERERFSVQLEQREPEYPSLHDMQDAILEPLLEQKSSG